MGMEWKNFAMGSNLLDAHARTASKGEIRMLDKATEPRDIEMDKATLERAKGYGGLTGFAFPALEYYINRYEDAQAQIKRLEAVVLAIRDYDNILDPSAAGLMAWVESVTFYEDIVEQMQEGDE